MVAEPTRGEAPTFDTPTPATSGIESREGPIRQPVQADEPAQALSMETSPPAASAHESESEYAPTSFIDRYRHLLDDDADSEPSPRLSRPILDDEYLSPAKAQLGDSPEEDSDEALEAYMSNLMRRVRGNASTETASPPADFADPLNDDAALPVASGDGHEAGAESAVGPDSDAWATELDANGLARSPRKSPAPTDLSALRELANTSARTAIARHRQRRHVESAVSKSIICVMASGVSAYLMLTAPSIESPWFWGGCVALVAAAGSAAQLLVLACRRWTDRRRFRILQAGDA
jgi:hypothetical protein